MNIDPNSIAYEVYSAQDLDSRNMKEFIVEITLLKRAFDRELEGAVQEGKSIYITSPFCFALFPNNSIAGIQEDLYDTVAELLGGTVFVVARDVETEESIGLGSLSMLEGNHETGELSDAFVRPEYRRNGIYAELIKQREELARNLGLTSLIVYPLSDGKSRRVLERNGYVVEERDEQVCMTKDLGGSIGESMNGNYGQRR